MNVLATVVIFTMTQFSGQVSDRASVQGECLITETTVQGNSLQGLLWPGQEIKIHSLGCGFPKRYDYIVFRSDEAELPVIKQLWGQPGDILTLLDNGRFEVNGVEAMTPFKKPYRLLGSAKTRLKKVAGEIDGYLVLGHPGSVDSGRIGLLSKADIMGYVLANQLGKTNAAN